MNPQDSENQTGLEETLDDLGVLIISDSQCEEIEQILVICKYCMILTFTSGVVILFWYLFMHGLVIHN